jgi:hypothetical protein
MKLVAMVTEPRNIVRFLPSLGEPTDVPARSPSVDAATAVLEEHRPLPQGARRRRVAYRNNTKGQTNAPRTTCTRGTPMRHFPRSATLGARSFDP